MDSLFLGLALRSFLSWPPRTSGEERSIEDGPLDDEATVNSNSYIANILRVGDLVSFRFESTHLVFEELCDVPVWRE